jgi:peptidylprolyl isomerase
MKIGSTVHLTYTGTLSDGTVFGYATEESPMIFQTGMDLTIPGFEEEILSMNEAGESKTFTVDQYHAYGEHLENWVEEVPRENIPYSDIQAGKRIWMLDEMGERFPVTVVNVGETMVTLDFNHPLAGQDLTFEVEILNVEDAPQDFVPASESRPDPKEFLKQAGIGLGDSGTVVL